MYMYDMYCDNFVEYFCTNGWDEAVASVKSKRYAIRNSHSQDQCTEAQEEKGMFYPFMKHSTISPVVA